MSETVSSETTEIRCLARKPHGARRRCALSKTHIYDHMCFIGGQAIYWARADDEPKPVVPAIYDHDFNGIIPVGSDIAVLVYQDGTYRVRHICTRPRDGATLIVAPTLQLNNGGHRIVSKDPFTVEPSIQCEDCGLHGYITNGAWRDV